MLGITLFRVPSLYGIQRYMDTSHSRKTSLMTSDGDFKVTRASFVSVDSGDLFGFVARCRLFHGLTSGEVTSIIHAAREQQSQRGAFFFHQGDPASLLYLLARGQVKLTQLTSDGHQVVVRYAGPGQVFAVLAAMHMPEYPVSAQAVEACQSLFWDGETIIRLMEQYPRLAINALELMAEQTRELQDRFRELATERVERRVARALLRLIRQTGRKVEGGVLVGIPLSRQDLAEMTGTTLHTVSRILSRWEQQGLTESGRERVIIRQPHALVTIAEDLPPTVSPEAT